jgi:hypothetical protein
MADEDKLNVDGPQSWDGGQVVNLLLTKCKQ